MKELILLLGISHLLGDFYFQTNKMAEKKKQKWPFLHSLIYMAMFVPIILNYEIMIGLRIGLIIGVGVTHGLIDRLFANPSKIKKYRFFIDQFSHIVVLVLVFTLGQTKFNCQLITNYYKELLLVGIMLLILKPAAIAVNKVLLLNSDKDNEEAFKMDAGVIIGMIERLIIVGMCILGDMGGIGFIIAAKTMVRYGEFAKEGTPDADTKLTRTKYLLGTLSSVAIALGCYGVWVVLR